MSHYSDKDFCSRWDQIDQTVTYPQGRRMSFNTRLSRAPHPFDPDLGQDALAHMSDLSPELVPLIVGAAGCSPYLAGLMAREGAWLPAAMDDPEAAVAAIFAQLPEVPLYGLPDACRSRGATQ